MPRRWIRVAPADVMLRGLRGDPPRGGRAGGVPAGGPRPRPGTPRAGPAARTRAWTSRSRRSIRRARAIWTRRCTSSAAATAIASTTRSQTSARSSPRAARSMPTRTRAASRSTRRTPTRRCIRRCSPRAPPACCPSSGGRPCCGRSTSMAAGELVETNVERAQVRSAAQHTYADVPPELAGLLKEVGERRLALERARGGVRLNVPEQEVVKDGSGWTVHYRVPLETEDHNAQISLLTGMAAAQLMLKAGVGILRTQPPPRRALAESPAPPGAGARGAVAGRRCPTPSSSGRWTRRSPRTPRSCRRPRASAAAPATPRSTARRRRRPSTSRSLRPTRMRRRRCAGCRTATSRSAAWRHAPAPRRPIGSAPGSPRSPARWRRATTAPAPSSAAIVDLVEAVLLQGREGETFDAVVIDDGLVQLRDPAVRGRIGKDAPEPGSEITVRLDRADPVARAVEFSVA